MNLFKDNMEESRRILSASSRTNRLWHGDNLSKPSVGEAVQVTNLPIPTSESEDKAREADNLEIARTQLGQITRLGKGEILDIESKMVRGGIPEKMVQKSITENINSR